MKLLLAATLVLCAFLLASCNILPSATSSPPRYQVDPHWPKPLPNQWAIGQIAGLHVDEKDQLWVLHRPRTIENLETGAAQNPPTAKCCNPAPPVLVIDREGNVTHAWGGPGAGYDWPSNEHGIYVDPKGNVWLGGNDAKDHHILKFTRDGKFLLQIGKPGKSEGSNSTTQLGRPASMELDPAANELYVADGYGNKRVIVFDADTGAYKRHWGAYGNKPDDAKMRMFNPESPQFANPVHCVRLGKDNLLYVCDRTNNRIQVFEKSGKFVRQYVVEPATRINGTVHDMILSPDPTQAYLFVGNGTDGEIYIMRRDSGERVASFGRLGRMAGEFYGLHNLAVDSRGNLYTGEVRSGKRVQRFVSR
jgi:DNA-binding beta-propeller fold protein YncE